MEPQTNQPQKPWYLNRETGQVVREFFAWILCIYMLYWNKQLDDEKTTILRAQIEVLQKQKESEERLLKITEKIVSKNNENQNNQTNNSSQSTDTD